MTGKPLLVMIPAMGSDARLYEKILPSLSAVTDPICILADRTSFRDCIAQVLEKAPASFIMLGTSFGGRLSLELTLAHPDRVKGLVVIGSGPGPVADKAGGLRRSKRLREGEFEEVVTEMADMISHMPGPNGPSTREAFVTMAKTQGSGFMARQSDALAQREDLRPRLGEITCPALMLWGVHDKFSPARDGLAMASAIPGARYVEIAECGHFPSLEAPEETADAILHWLKDSRFISG